MNDKKIKFEIVSAAMSILVGCATIIYFMGSIIYFNNMNGKVLGGDIFLLLIVNLLAIAIIIVGSVFVSKYRSETLKNTKGLIVALLVLVSVLTFLYCFFIARSYNGVEYTFLQLCTAIIIITIMSLYIKNDPNQDNLQNDNTKKDND